MSGTFDYEIGSVVGPQGPAATIAVGDTTTLQPGNNATVTNSGTSGAAVFNFGIPQGATGATGNGIASISKTGSAGLVDTYRILYTSGEHFDFTVTNGANGEITGSSIADTFSTSANYASGDPVIYSGQLYFFNAAHTAGAWTGTDATAVQLAETVRDLKSALTDISETIFTVIADVGAYIPFVVHNGDSITVKTSSGNTFGGTTNIGLYDSGYTAIASFSVSATYGSERTLSVNLSETAYFIRLNPASGFVGESLEITNNSNHTLEKIASLDAKISAKVNYSLYATINQSNNYTGGGYIALNGGIGNTVNTSPVSSTQRAYIILPCHAGDSFILTATGGSGPRAWGFTDTEYKLLSVAGNGSGASNLKLTAEYDGYFISNHDITKSYALSATQLFKAAPESAVDLPPVIVDASGSGDYTSFTLACKENYNNNKAIVVKPGTYNIVSEYVAIWGQSAVDNMADADTATFDGWQYGVKMNGRKFIFEPGAKLVCDWTGHTVDGTHRFSALRVEMDVEIDGLDLDCTSTFYAIHDDYGVQTRPYTVTYRRCKVVGHSLNNANCIGGGCKKWSKHILDNCYFDNNLTNSATVRYHNTNQADAVPEIYVSNTYFNNWFTPRYYGTQATKMRVYVNNCEARSIHILQESESYNVENVELYKWCCTETNPVTS